MLGLLLLCMGFSSCVTWAQQLWCTGLTALLLHVESSRTRSRTPIPCSGRWVPNYWTTWEVPQFFNYSISVCSWQIDGETMETVRDFIFLGSKITADGDCSHEIKRRLLLGIKAITILDSILKNRDIILPTKVHVVKAMVFPVVMCECESWTIKKSECQRIDAFELWYWRRLLRVFWTARKSK